MVTKPASCVVVGASDVIVVVAWLVVVETVGVSVPDDESSAEQPATSTIITATTPTH